MKLYDHITKRIEKFIAAQKIFFVATAADHGRINLSPKGMDSFRVIDKNKVLWLNLTGSGNETAAHLLKNDRMTIMFCSFEGKPLILRLYGNARIFHEKDQVYQTHIDMFPRMAGSRQIIEMDVDLAQTSCGFAVPLMDFREERTHLNAWAEKQGEERLEEYRKKKNARSIDGFDTGTIGH